MRVFVYAILFSLTLVIFGGCSSTEYETPSCNGEPDQEQLNKYVCAQCDGMKFLQVVCEGGHLSCPIEARGKEFYKVVKYEDWKNGKGDCIMAK
ncbi:MAG: hypothetical protein N2746_01630 [Deltaproteobacteria bacterium]|nr:hypothetical protein [Deltaproteobacteria bacterium]